MQKTTIQVLLDAYTKRGKEVEHRMLNCFDESNKAAFAIDKTINDMIVKDLKASLATEKSQIIAAWMDGAYAENGTSASDYYLTTFTALDGDKSKENGAT